jgi:hypothetical protein
MGRGYTEKGLNENLAPLRRWLGRQVGRPWAKVFSELCARLSVSCAVQKHVRDHVGDYVVVSARIGEDGRVYGTGRFGGYGPVVSAYRETLYVCPRTGLLRRAPKAEVVRRGEGRALEGGRYLVRRGDTHLLVTTIPSIDARARGLVVCAVTGVRTTPGYGTRHAAYGVPWDSDRVAIAAVVPGKAALSALFREAEQVARRSRLR